MVSVALVGLGDIGLSAHLPALARHPEVQVAALVDPSADRRAQAAAQLESQAGLLHASGSPPAPLLTAELDDALDAGIDAVVLATPPWVTPALTVRAVRRGSFVLAEKPVATSVVAAAEHYDELTDDEVRRIQIGLTYRHDPAIQQLGQWLRDGRLGPTVLVRAHIYDEQLYLPNIEHLERIKRTLQHGTPVVHEGAHVFDWLSFLLGASPTTIDDAWQLRTQADLPAANLTGARLSYPGGHTALVEFGWLTEALPRCELTFLGARGLATLDGSTFRLELRNAAGEEVVDPPGDRMQRCFDLQVARFVDLVSGRAAQPTPSLADGRAALETAEQVAALAAARGA